MKRSVSQALHKYLPESFIDFVFHTNERHNYTAYVKEWNCEKLNGINKSRLIRSINLKIEAFNSSVLNDKNKHRNISITPLLEEKETNVLCPIYSKNKSTVIAKISPLVFYCPKCRKVYQFDSSAYYSENKKCKKCNVTLKQFRKVYYCRCSFATDKYDLYCKKCGSDENIYLLGSTDNYEFICMNCGEKVSAKKICEKCKSVLEPKDALASSQYFAHSLNMPDVIGKRFEDFIGASEVGSLFIIAYRIGKITSKQLNYIISNKRELEALLSEKEKIKAMNNEEEKLLDGMSEPNKKQLYEYVKITEELKNEILLSDDDLITAAESVLEYILIDNLRSNSSLSDAEEVNYEQSKCDKLLKFKEKEKSRGILSAKMCTDIPFVRCSYGFTREKPYPSEGVVLKLFDSKKGSKKNVYATRLNTEAVLLEFDRTKILSWLIKNDYINKDIIPDMNDEKAIKLWFINHVNLNRIKPFLSIKEKYASTYYVYNLLHTLSHLLIRSASKMCGLSKNSISEYILPCVPAVLIYCQNSPAANLGALYNLVEGYFDKWIDNAYNMAQKCIFDPICIERYKACSGCLFLNDISCQHSNHDLDRSLIVGSIDKAFCKKTGFWQE